MPGKSVAKVTDPMVELKAYAEELPFDEGDEDITDLIVGRILSATSVDELLTPTSAPSMGDLAGQPLIIHGARKRQGGLNKTLGFFLLLDVENQSTGIRDVFSTGAINIVTQVLKAAHDGDLPLACEVREYASKSNPERTVHWLVKIGEF
jgi:hypothetical protein